ncbi:MAG: hypothetical protein ACM30I_08825 [Gemmatimonas sp.]
MAHDIVLVENGSVRDDGQVVKFDIRTRAGETLPIEMPTRDIVKFVAFLCTLGQFAARKNPSQDKTPPTEFEGPLIEAENLGLARGRTDKEVIMALQVGLFALGVALPTEKLDFLRALVLHGSAQPNQPN